MMPATLIKKPLKRKSRIKKSDSKKAPTVKTKSNAYDSFKFYDGKQYTGMPVGRSHKWYYDKGDWRETKITPDLWEISYAVTKRRAGHAPKGSGVPLGTEYQWYILAHQNVCKLDKDDYSTSLTGLKFKLAHKRAKDNKWSGTTKAQRKKLIALLKEMINDLQKKALEFEFEYQGSAMKAEAMPISQTCMEGGCSAYDISVNNKHLGIIKQRKSGWKLDNAPDPKFIQAIGKAIESLINK